VTTLVVRDLVSTLSQPFTLSNETRYSVGAFIPYLYLHNAPDGTFSLSVFSGDDELATKSFDSSDIKASLDTSDDYLHVFFPVLFDNPVQLCRGEYLLVLSASGYAPTQSSFIGWIQQHENLNNITDYTPSGDDQNPLAFRLKVLRRY
jgi:hypothetical protein